MLSRLIFSLEVLENLVYDFFMPKHLTIDQASGAFERAMDTVGLDDLTRTTLEKQVEFELWYEAYGEALEQEELLELAANPFYKEEVKC